MSKLTAEQIATLLIDTASKRRYGVFVSKTDTTAIVATSTGIIELPAADVSTAQEGGRIYFDDNGAVLQIAPAAAPAAAPRTTKGSPAPSEAQARSSLRDGF